MLLTMGVELLLQERRHIIFRLPYGPSHRTLVPLRHRFTSTSACSRRRATGRRELC